MLPSRNHPKWEKLVTGEISYKFNLFAASMLMTRITKTYAAEKTPEKLKSSVDEIYIFFTKYESVLFNDIKEIFS